MTHIHTQVLPDGTQIGVYEIKSVAKITAFEITYRAWNHHLKEQVKIREYFPYDFAQRSADHRSVEAKSPEHKENYDYGLRAFLNQAEVLTQIEHPHLVPLENILPFNGTAYMIIGIREGMPLSRLVQSQSSFAPTELKFILASILSALQELHEHKIVHGGIQPATILIGKEGLPLLVNVASARLAIAARTAQYAEELATGYAPAEQFEPANVIGPPTDFYALGATIYACMTHRQPVAAQARKMALSRGEPDPMALPPESADAASNPNPELLEAIQWMLRPDYTDRPQSTGEILALLKSEQISVSSDATLPLQANPDHADDRPVARNTVLLAIGIGIAALVGVGVWWNEEPAEAPAIQSTAVDNRPAVPVMPVETAVASDSAIDQPVVQAAERPELASPTVTAIEPETTETAHARIEPTQQLVASEQPQPRQMELSKQSSDTNIIDRHLVAAGIALKAGRLTTPAKDNANKYYQMVLDMDPDNSHARIGQQKIVDQYVQFIASARARGQRDIAKRYLQRAESVLPDDPRLERIRAQLGTR